MTKTRKSRKTKLAGTGAEALIDQGDGGSWTLKRGYKGYSKPSSRPYHVHRSDTERVEISCRSGYNEESASHAMMEDITPVSSTMKNPKSIQGLHCNTSSLCYETDEKVLMPSISWLERSYRISQKLAQQQGYRFSGDEDVMRKEATFALPPVKSLLLAIVSKCLLDDTSKESIIEIP